MKIYEHLEEYLGPIIKGWGTTENSLDIEVSLFLEADKPQVNTFTTLGLNKHLLAISDKKIRQEFVFSAHESYSADEVSSFLLTFAEGIAARGTGLLRGDFFEGKPVIEGVSVTGIYASIPVFWPDSFHIFEGTEPNTIVVWLMPITHREAVIIKRQGWSYFEKHLEETDCDFWDLNRESMF